MFEHEKLEVYQLARELNREIYRLTKIASAGSYEHLNQLVRAGASLPRNIAEGGVSGAQKKRPGSTATRNVQGPNVVPRWTCSLITKCCENPIPYTQKDLLRRIIPMLVKLIQLFESGGPRRSLQSVRAPSRARPPVRNPGPSPGP
jgi:hypothetical protein